MRKMRHTRIRGCLTVLAAVVVGGFLAAVAGWRFPKVLPVKEDIKEVEQNVSKPEPSDEGKGEEPPFYYSQLESEEERIVYHEVLEGVKENRKEILLQCKDADMVNSVFLDVLNDHPEIFWCDGNATSTQFSESMFQEAYVVLNPSYSYSGAEKENRMVQIESAASECLNQIPTDSSEYEKIKFVYEYLIQTVDYDLDAEDNQNIYSALVGKASVCAGYAKSFQYLMDQMQIGCIYVTGTATDLEGNTEEHAWNIVKCGGKYYFVDVTWGDPVFQQEEETNTLNIITYDYLCCSGKEIYKTHKTDEKYEYPLCEQDDLNYYKMKGMYYDTFDRDSMEDAMHMSIDAKEAASIFKMENRALYQQVVESMKSGLLEQGARYLGEKYHLEEIRYSYVEDPVLNKFTICWYYD